MIDASIMAVVLFMINRPFYNGLINYTLFQIKRKEKEKRKIFAILFDLRNEKTHKEADRFSQSCVIFSRNTMYLLRIIRHLSFYRLHCITKAQQSLNCCALIPSRALKVRRIFILYSFPIHTYDNNYTISKRCFKYAVFYYIVRSVILSQLL